MCMALGWIQDLVSSSSDYLRALALIVLQWPWGFIAKLGQQLAGYMSKAPNMLSYVDHLPLSVFGEGLGVGRESGIVPTLVTKE